MNAGWSRCGEWSRFGRLATAAVTVMSKKNLNAAKPPEQTKGLGGNIGCKVKKIYQNATRPYEHPPARGEKCQND